ncbi:MAG TPA: D-ribose pyranase [Streptosporangiaceae bacterium]|jgi:D-ribose pyranase
MLRYHALLNPALLAHLAGAGHTDLVVIADAGLPLPPGVPVVDLSLVPGTPSFAGTATAVLAALAVESAVIAAESAGNPAEEQLAALLDGLPVEVVSHARLQELSRQARVIVRTGECTPYANVVLIAGVTF